MQINGTSKVQKQSEQSLLVLVTRKKDDDCSGQYPRLAFFTVEITLVFGTLVWAENDGELGNSPQCEMESPGPSCWSNLSPSVGVIYRWRPVSHVRCFCLLLWARSSSVLYPSVQYYPSSIIHPVCSDINLEAAWLLETNPVQQTWAGVMGFSRYDPATS